MKSLKLTTALFLALLSTGLTACKKDNKETTTTIAGKWSVKSYVITNFENRGVDVDDTKDQKIRPTFDFNNNGTFTSTLEITPQVIRYIILGDKVTFDKEIAFDHKIFTYNVNGSLLTLTRTDNRQTNNKINYIENTTIT